MNYLQWNDILFEYYFGEDSEHEVFLGIDKDSLVDYVLEKGVLDDEISKIVKNRPNQKVDPASYAWDNFTRLFRTRETSSKSDLFAVFRAHLNDSAKPDKLPTIFPCVALFIMALANNPEMDPRNFYGRVTQFFKNNRIIGANESIGTQDMSQFNRPTLKTMWENLEIWARSEGYQYRVKSNTNSQWKYVAPFMAESLLTATQRDKFKIIFYKSGLTPDQDLSDERINDIIQRLHNDIGFTDEEAWNKLFRNYGNILIDEFRRQYNKWDGNTIVRLHENERRISREYGTNKKLYLCMEQFRGCFDFFFKALFKDSEPGADYEYKGDGYPEFVFSISSDGYSDEKYRPTNLKDFFAAETGIALRDASNPRNRLTFNLEDFYLFEKYYSIYTSECKLKKGGRFYFLVKESRLQEYQKWLDDNNAQIITGRQPFEGLYNLYYIESVMSSMTDHDKLNCEDKKVLKLVDTFVIEKGSSNTLLYQGLPAYFQIDGINVATDKIRIVFDQGHRIMDKQLEYDEERRLWKVPVITDRQQLNERFRVYCNDEPISSARFSFGNFKQLSEYNEIGYDSWGNYTETDSVFKGLTINCKPGLPSLLEDNMNKFGGDPTFEKRAYNPTDYLLYWLSTRTRTDKDEFSNAIGVQEKNAMASETPLGKWDVKTLIDNYCRLGYINYAYYHGKHIIAINKPTFILLPSSVRKDVVAGVSMVSCAERQYKILLTGARTPEFIDKLIKRAEGFNCNGVRIMVQVDEASSPLYPQRIIFWTPSIDAIKAFAEKYGIQYQHTFYANSMLKTLGSVDEYESYVTEKFSDFQETYEGFNDRYSINYKLLLELMSDGKTRKLFERVKSTKFDMESDVVTYFPGKYMEKTILWKNGRQYPVDKYWGYFLGMKNVNAKVAEVNREDATLQLPDFIKLPALYARALTMMSGEIPEFCNTKRIYQLCDNPFAGASSPDNILRKLSQN